VKLWFFILIDKAVLPPPQWLAHCALGHARSVCFFALVVTRFFSLMSLETGNTFRFCASGGGMPIWKNIWPLCTCQKKTLKSIMKKTHHLFKCLCDVAIWIVLAIMWRPLLSVSKARFVTAGAISMKLGVRIPLGNMPRAFFYFRDHQIRSEFDGFRSICFSRCIHKIDHNS
jgi:hypothetical protein